jgi:hypothetical protein
MRPDLAQAERDRLTRAANVLLSNRLVKFCQIEGAERPS